MANQIVYGEESRRRIIDGVNQLANVGISRDDLGALVQEAGQQWTGTFNPRPFGKPEALEVYRCAY